MKVELQNKKEKVERREKKIKTLQEEADKLRELVRKLLDEVDNLKEESTGRKKVEAELVAELKKKEDELSALKEDVQKLSQQKEVPVFKVDPAVRSVLQKIIDLGEVSAGALQQWESNVAAGTEKFGSSNHKKKAVRCMRRFVIRDLRLFPKDEDDPESILDQLYGLQDDRT